MRDFRFHVASLMAVFLALGVGIFIGYGIALSIGMEPLQHNITAIQKHGREVEETNRDLKESTTALQGEQKRLHAEVNRLADLSVLGRLSGRSVALVSVGNPQRGVIDAIWNILLLAGAQRQSDTHIRGALLPSKPQDQKAILTEVHADPALDPRGAVQDAVARSIASTDGDPRLLESLFRVGVPVDWSGSYAKSPQLVVLLTSVDTSDRLDQVERGTTVETGLVRALSALGVRVVECEVARADRSAASYFRRLGISSVDNIDTPEGQVSLVWAGLGYSAHYGQQPGADSLLPRDPGQ